MPLRQVFPDPESENSSGKAANVDIIAVHGLNVRSKDEDEHAWNTWRRPAGEKGYLWLRDDLPNHIPLARIFLYIYDATAVYGNDQATFSDKANELLEAIRVKRGGVESRRILFLGHSMGGLLIKQALINAHSNITYTQIKKATTGIAFFATPQFGGAQGQVKLGKMAAEIAKSLGFKKGDNVIQTLEGGSMFSDLMQEHFRHQLSYYDIVSFWGSRDKIVPRESTWFGLPGDQENIVKLDAGHGGVCKFGEGRTDQDNLEIVRHNIIDLYAKALNKSPEPFTRQASQPCYYIPFQKNKCFVGRDEPLNSLKQKLFVQKTSQEVAVFGLGGVGKTQVALQIAYWVKENKTEYSVFWISALSEESFNFACMEIAEKLGIQKPAKDEEPREMVRKYLSLEAAGKWLLVVDNADDMDLLFGPQNSAGGIFHMLPKSEHGLTLFTTRSREVASGVARSNVVDLQEMSSNEGMDLLRLFVLEDEPLMTELLEKLTFLPLAITQAAAYLYTKQVSIGEYLELLDGTEQDLVGLLSKEFPDNTRYRDSQNAIATTWLVSFEHIRKSDNAAADLLLFISCIEPKRIPRSLLPSPGSTGKLQDALGTLCTYAFLTPQRGNKEFDMHGLVHLAARVWAEKKGLMTKSIETAIRHLAAIFPNNDFGNRYLWKAYLPHLLQVLQQGDGLAMEERSDLYSRAGSCLEVDGRIKEAVSCFGKRHRWTKEHLPEDDPSRLTAGHNLARTCLANGQTKEAVELLEHVVKCRENTLAKDHPDRLLSQHELGRAYQYDGQVEKSIELLERVLVLRNKAPVENKEAIFWSQHELGRAYLAQRQIGKAIEVMKQTLEARKKTLAQDDEATLWSRHELGRAYLDNGQRKKAIKELKHVVDVRRRTLEENHPALLWSQHELARGYRDDRQTKRAIKLLEHVVTIRKTLDENDPARLWSEHELARTYTDDGQVEKAIELLEHVVALRKSLAEDNPDRRFSEKELERAYNERDEHQYIWV